MEIYGEDCGPNDVAREVLKDKTYFQKSGGGVTLSGGEPTMQSLFAKGLLSSFKQGGIHTALDTCGHYPWETLDELLPYTDLVLYDLKEINADKHKAFTGASNTRILENLILLSRFMKEHSLPGELWIRTPLIPGCTATPENLRGIGMFIKEHVGASVSRWELCTCASINTRGWGASGRFGRPPSSPGMRRKDSPLWHRNRGSTQGSSL
jgi:pyruvate formate lyase activating enzyme